MKPLRRQSTGPHRRIGQQTHDPVIKDWSELGTNSSAVPMPPRTSPTIKQSARRTIAEGKDWCVAWPDGHSEEIPGFESETEANGWIAKSLQTWLEERKKKDAAA